MGKHIASIKQVRQWCILQNGIGIRSGLGRSDPNNMFDEKYEKSNNSGVSLTKLLNWLKDVVDCARGVRGRCTGAERPRDHGNDQIKGLKLNLVPSSSAPT